MKLPGAQQKYEAILLITGIFTVEHSQAEKQRPLSLNVLNGAANIY